MVHVIAIITAKPGQRGAVLAAFLDNRPRVLAEEGCIEYGPVTDADGAPPGPRFGDDTFVVIEKWSSLETLAAHAASPHMRDYAARVSDLVADRAVHVLTDAT